MATLLAVVSTNSYTSVFVGKVKAYFNISSLVILLMMYTCVAEIMNTAVVPKYVIVHPDSIVSTTGGGIYLVIAPVATS
jgi:hypothetical protein